MDVAALIPRTLTVSHLGLVCRYARNECTDGKHAKVFVL